MHRQAPPGSTRQRQDHRGGPRAGARSSAASTLALQRGAGNAAVVQLLARKQGAAPKQPARPVATGLRKQDAIERFAMKAHRFWRQHPDSPVDHYVRYLGAAASTELDAVGVPGIEARLREGMGSSAGEFHAEFWSVIIDPRHVMTDEKHKRFEKEGRTPKIGDLEDFEAALLATKVYHEARHAEQNFRVARAMAAEIKGDPEAVKAGILEGFRLDEDVAAAAARNPLGSRASTQERNEARLWRENVVGADDEYRQAVTWWQGEARDAARQTKAVKPGDADDVKAMLERRVKAWAKPDGAAGYIRSHAGSARSRKSARGAAIVKEIASIHGAFTQVESAVKQLGDGWSRRDAAARAASFKTVHAALVALARALNDSYRAQPVEHDAHATGDAVFEAFERRAKAAQRR